MILSDILYIFDNLLSRVAGPHHWPFWSQFMPRQDRFTTNYISFIFIYLFNVNFEMILTLSRQRKGNWKVRDRSAVVFIL